MTIPSRDSNLRPNIESCTRLNALGYRAPFVEYFWSKECSSSITKGQVGIDRFQSTT
ncbi:Hypothetical protein FKW44_020881 [Caligus rogercresseyi]|uniref:Uncharacterized protein n=1 Tax=Caligus rogercresseyi TaxID=217165 RepID=A0A7T8GR22_CALRO|nr:Hypothetical protein FKW44_020881 [Caligus rogercresseyi]